MSNARTCGNCRTPVTPDATFCPECGALLSAYESPAGSTATADLTIPPTPTTTSAPVVTTTVAPSATTPAPWAVRTTPAPRPASISTTTPAPILPDPATDDLAAMAAPSGFAQSIEADLADAKVVFDDKAHAVIETAPTAPDLDLTAGEPVPGSQRQPRSTTTRPPRTTTTRAPRTTTTRTPRTTTTRFPRPGATRTEFTEIELDPAAGTGSLDPDRELNPPRPPAREPWRSTPARSAADAPPPPKPTTFMQSKYFIPAIVIGLIVINIVARNPGFGMFLLVAAVLIIFLMRGAIGASKSSARTTSRMPKDDRNRR